MKNPRCRDACEAGVTGAEYALVVSFVSLLLVAGAVTLGSEFSAWTDGIVNQLGTLLG